MAHPAAIPFALVDVFTDSPLAGNPLAVVPDAAGLEGEVLAKLAREFNLSETTFLYSPTVPTADWKLRSFTPSGVEVFGAGHNALGAWWWLAAMGRLVLQDPLSRFHQQLGQAVLPVSIQVQSGRPRAIGMQQERPTFGRRAGDATELTAALGLAPADLALDLPAQVVSTGVAHLLVPVRRTALERASPQPTLPALVQALGGEGCYVFTLDTQDTSAVAEARFFSPGVGISGGSGDGYGGRPP